MINPHTLVVVADGTSAVLWLNHGNGPEANLELVETLAFADVVNDGPAGSSPTERSTKENEEATFIKHLAHRLNTMALKNAIKGDVILIADPNSLGQIRPQLHAELVRRIVREIPKTLVKASKGDLEKALA